MGYLNTFLKAVYFKKIFLPGSKNLHSVLNGLFYLDCHQPGVALKQTVRASDHDFTGGRFVA